MEAPFPSIDNSPPRRPRCRLYTSTIYTYTQIHSRDRSDGTRLTFDAARLSIFLSWITITSGQTRAAYSWRRRVCLKNNGRCANQTILRPVSRPALCARTTRSDVLALSYRSSTYLACQRVGKRPSRCARHPVYI